MKTAYLLIDSPSRFSNVLRYNLCLQVTIIGRHESCHLIFTSPKVSNYHFSIIKWFDDYILRDGMPSVDKIYNKTNPGTTVNNEVVYKSKLLESGDLICLPDGILIKYVVDNIQEREPNYLSTLGQDKNDDE